MSRSRSSGKPSSSANHAEHASSQAESWANPYEAFYVRAYCARRKARVDHGVAYPVDEEQLRILQSELFSESSANRRPYPSPVSMSVADDRLQHLPDQVEPEVSAAIDRIEEYTSEDRDIKWDLVIKIFDDFDTAYFQGMLQRRILVQWAAFKEHPEIFAADPTLANLGLTLAPKTLPNQTSRVRIYLRSDFRWDKLPRLYVLGCLMHEMLHAYFIVSCGPDWAQEVGAEDPRHGPLFVRAAKWLEGRSGLDLLSDWHEVAMRIEEGSR